MFSVQFLVYFLLEIHVCLGNNITTKVNIPHTNKNLHKVTEKKINSTKDSHIAIKTENKDNLRESIHANIIIKKEEINDSHFTRIDHNIIPLIQKRLDNEKIKKSLDEFTMVRRKTHFTMPDFKYNDLSKKDSHFQDLDVPYSDYNTIHKKVNGIISNEDYTDIVYNEVIPDTKFSSEYQDYEEESKIINLLRKQTKIIKKLAETIEMDNRKQNKISDFDALMNEVQEKQDLAKQFPNYTAFTFETTTKKTTTKSTTTEKPTTILTLFDEVDVRHALKSDPHVKRILKMANRKRERYLKNARRFHSHLIGNRFMPRRHYNNMY